MRTRPSDQVPPHDLPAEAAVIGCLITSPAECLPPTLHSLVPESFYDLRHKILFARLSAMHRAGEKIDPITLYSALKLAGELESAGGIAYVSGLPDSVASTANLPAYIAIVVKYAATRQATEAAWDILQHIERGPENAGPVIHVAALAFNALERTFSGEDKREPAVIDAAEMISLPREVPPEIVTGVLHRGSKLVLGGGSKSYKTWTLLDLAVSVSHGAPWLGFPTRKGRVLYVNLEIQEGFFARRLEQVCSAKGITLEPGQLLVLNLRGHCAEFETVLPKIEEFARTQGCVMIVLDPIYKLYGSTDENSAGDVARLLNGIERLAVSTGAAVAFGAHFSKGNQAAKESIDRISGSGVFARDPDSILVLTRHEEENAFTLESTLRNLPPLDPFVVRWNHPLMSRDDGLDPARLKKAKGRAPNVDYSEILDLIPPSGLTLTTWKQKAQELGVSSSSFHRARRELKGNGSVCHNRITGLWLRA